MSVGHSNRNTRVIILAYIFGMLSVFVLLNIFTQDHWLSESDSVKVSNVKNKGLISIPFNVSYVEKYWDTLNQADPHLIQYTRVKYLNPPSTLPYKRRKTSLKSKTLKWVANHFRKKRNGIFIEAGAYNGDSTWSTTYYLEKVLGWTGLLVECNPVIIPELLMQHRRAWVAGVCLAPGKHPQNTVLRFPPGHEYTGNVGVKNHPPPFNKYYAKLNWKTMEVKSIPLYTLIAALGWTEIDFFSFDVEKMELPILKSFPFDKVTFKVVAIEVHWYNKSEKKELADLFAKNGYLAQRGSFGFDRIYLHKSVANLTKS